MGQVLGSCLQLEPRRAKSAKLCCRGQVDEQSSESLRLPFQTEAPTGTLAPQLPMSSPSSHPFPWEPVSCQLSSNKLGAGAGGSWGSAGRGADGAGEVGVTFRAMKLGLLFS